MKVFLVIYWLAAGPIPAVEGPRFEIIAEPNRTAMQTCEMRRYEIARTINVPGTYVGFAMRCVARAG